MKIVLKIQKSHEGILGNEYCEEYDLKYNSEKRALVEKLNEAWEEKGNYEREEERKKFDKTINLILENKVSEINDCWIGLGDYDLFLEKI